MKKVIYSVTKYGRNETKVSGIGYVTDEDLVIAAISKSGKPYVRIFEDCIKRCYKVQGKNDEFKGNITEIIEVELETKNNNYDTREIEVEYGIWFKYTD